MITISRRQLIQVAMPLAVAIFFYWGIFASPSTSRPGSGSGPRLTPEEARQMLERVRVARIQEQKYEEALALAQQLHDDYPLNHIYLEELGTVHGKLGHYKEEAETWEQYMRVSPTPVEACPHLAVSYQRQGRLDQ
ncbi:MAG TPA: hypothetical protein VFV34_21420, partial [Blastocatellia bacterium]|nr:hypothetical protein [Blastocatellia bacterium]